MHSKRLSGVVLFLLMAFIIPHVVAQGGEAESRLWASVVRAWFDKGDYDSAARWLKDYLKHSADPDMAYTYLYSLYQKGAYGALLSEARKGRCAPVASEVRGRILVGLAHWRQGNLVAALQAWTVVLGANPRDDRVWECVRIAILTAPRRNRTVLVQGLQQGLGNSPFASSFLLGLLEYIRGENERAEQLLKAARDQFPESRTVALAFRDLYRHTGNVEACRLVDDWLAHTPTMQISVKSNNINVPYLTSSPAEAAPMAYRLPWPAGKAVFCASHEGRRGTPHSGRGRYALDFFLPKGMAIVAARDGVVSRIADLQETSGNHEFGTFVLVDHGDGTFARYYHLRGGTVRVRIGQIVRQGDALAESGRTGRCQSQHLHFEVLRKDRWRLSGPKIYWGWQTVPVDFEETRNLAPEEIPDRWLVSNNGALAARR